MFVSALLTVALLAVKPELQASALMPPERFTAFVAAKGLYDEAKVPSLERDIKDIIARQRKARNSSAWVPSAIKATKQKIATVKAGGYVPLKPETLNVGDIGTLDNGIEIFQILDESSYLAKCLNSDEILMMRWLPTARLVDGNCIHPEVPFWVSGTERYATALGSKTVKVLEFADVVRAGDNSPKKRR